MLSDMNHARSSKTTEIVEEYISSLQDLNANSKPHINMLTLLADDYIEYASAIVEAVEAHLQKVRSEVKLPVLYLIDSIVKNVNGSYLNLFSKNIVQTFCDVFEKVDENTRAKMWKLRQTWNEVFPIKKLISLDVRVHNIDPAWPISSVPPNAVPSKSLIHVNPKFLSMQQKVQQQQQKHHQPPMPQPKPQPQPSPPVVVAPAKVAVVEPVAVTEEQMREELLKKQRELIKLQKHKLEMLKKCNLERPHIHVKPELIAPDGTLKKPILTTVPCVIKKSLEKQPSAPTIASPAPSDHKPSLVPTLLPADPRLRTAAALQNGIASPASTIVQQPTPPTNDDHPPKQPTTPDPSVDEATKPPVKPLADPTDATPTAQTSPSDTSPILTTDEADSLNQKQKPIPPPAIPAPSTSTDLDSCTESKKPSSPAKTRSSSSRKSSSRPGKSQHGDSSSPSAHKKSSNSRKRSSSGERHHHHHHRPHHHHHHQNHHHHHRHHSPKVLTQGLDEEEQFGGSLIVSPPQPSANVFKDRRDSGSSASVASSRARRSCRDSSSRSRSPESGREEGAAKRRDSSSSSKDEDLRAALIAATASSSAAAAAVAAKVAKVAAALETKEDLDLRVLPGLTSNKRQSSELLQAPNAKKQKDEKFDDLFGKEDVDLRLLTPAPPKVIATQQQQQQQQSTPQPPTPPTPPPPVISNDKAGWAKFKTPSKDSPRTGASSFSRSQGDRSASDRNRDRLSRTKLYNRQQLDDPKDRRRGGREYERNADRNIEIIMKEAAEELNQGTITKAQYNKLIQEVLHMSEDEKLRAAQRKERESKVWERNDKGMRMKEHGMHPRPPGPRWQSPWHQPWAHPPGPFQSHFRPDFRPPIGPWQSHPRLFGPGPMRPPDFHQFHAGFNPRLAHGPLILPNGQPLNPMNPMNVSAMAGPLGPMPPGMILGAGAPMIPKRDGSGEGVTWAGAAYGGDGKPTEQDEVSSSSGAGSEELPAADQALLEDIAKDTMRSINIDNVSREIRYYGHTGVIFMHWDDPRDIGFQNGARRISIDGKDAVVCSFNDDYREFNYEGEVHRIKLGAPTRELYIDDKWYQVYFGGQPIVVDLGNKNVNVKLEGPPPQVKIGTTKRTDLVIGKINLIINARSMVPVFLDAKPQMFNIEGNPCTLEFNDALQTVLLNGRPFKVEFGGLPKPVNVAGKKHFVRFSVLPRGFRAGYVRIQGMKGEQPKESPTRSTPTAARKAQGDKVAAGTTAVASPCEPDSTSQDGLDHSYTSKSDLQLDVLSSVVPSAMAPSSGLSYQAEPVENPSATAPAVTLPLNLNELFQRLVETGIVSNLSEAKKPEEEEKKAPEIALVSFDKPETLKIKNPAMVTGLYSGIQCSSCGARFAPEMATRYSHHLDWHFRQNRKERDSSRKAHSRLWYYDVSDWIQFEEIEDLEDRAQSWFETEKQTLETENAAAEELFAETLQPSVPTGRDEDSCCQVCHEAFEQFYNDEKEEWHLRPAVTHEDKNFHPLCLEDHKRAMGVSASTLDPSEKNEDNKDKLSDSIVKVESIEVKTQGEDSEANVSIKEEEVSESMDVSVELVETIDQKIEEIALDVSLELLTQEIKIEGTDVNTSLELTQEMEAILGDTSESISIDIEIKDEPVSIKEEPAELESAPEDSTAESAVIDSTQVEVKSTIDGNVELDSTASTIPAAQSKIKLNITKALGSPRESKETKDDKEAVLETTTTTTTTTITTTTTTVAEDEEEPEEPLKPASIKPALLERNLSVLPPVERCVELSALCSIM